MSLLWCPGSVAVVHRSGTQTQRGKHESPNKITALHVICAFWVIVAVGIGLGYFFAPKKPSAPPPSSMEYSRRPSDAPEFGGDDSGDGSRASRRNAAPVVHSQASQVRPDQKKSDYSAYGTITDKKTGKPVSNAHVFFERILSDEEKAQWQELRDSLISGASSDPADELGKLTESLQARSVTTSDPQGRYVADLHRDGVFAVSISANGYLPLKPQPISVTADEKKIKADFALSTGAGISGKVTEARSKKGAPRVRIYATGEAPGQDASTQADGAYALKGLVPGTYMVTLDLRHSAYQVSGRAPTREVTITGADQEVKDINFVVEEAGVVWGYVWGADKKPIKGADVVLCSSESIVTQAIQAAVKQAPPLHDTSNADGYYELMGVPLNSEWRVYTQADDFAPQLSDPFLLTDKQRQARVDLFVLPGSDIHGWVVSSLDGTPVARAEVQCIPGYMKFLSPLDSPAAFRHSHTREDGSFDITDLPIGEYQLLAVHDKFRFATTGEPIYPDGMHDISGVRVALTPVASGQYSVFGTVSDQAGSPIVGAELHLLSASGENMAGEVQDTKTDAQGQYLFTGVDAGFFVLAVEASGYTTKTVDKVRLDEETNVVLDAGASISGRVLIRETSAPPPSYQVRAIPSSMAAGGFMDFIEQANSINPHSFNNPDGNYTLSVPAGSYTLQAFSHGLTSGTQNITVSQGDRQTGVDLYLSQNGGRIQGRIVLADGKSPAGASAAIGGEGSSLGDIAAMMAQTMQRNIQVGDDGQFTFSNLPPGAYTIAGQFTGYAQGRSQPIVLTEGQTVSGIQVTLGHGGELQGYVTLDGQLKPGVIVTVVGNGVSQMATTDHNGQYRIQGLAAGTYMASAVSLDAAGLSSQFSALHAQVQIAEGAQTTYNFGSEVGATVNGACAPPPSAGTVGIALIRIPGGPPGLSALSLGNPSSWFDGASSAGNYIIGMSRIDSYGYFTIPSVPRGTFVLDVYYMNMGQLLSGGGRPAYSAALTVPDESEISVEIAVNTG
ncbi:MAG: carboxypeptidase regulatory-like domain-containing protein [Candidatus Hydrogenedentes bacterium]|nr:carboxypeptidase regulatory-like domain-containing protein [Candidatus Hydrogenedentota bacterium]